MCRDKIIIGGIIKNLSGMYTFRVKTDSLNTIRHLKNCTIQITIMQGMDVKEENGYYDDNDVFNYDYENILSKEK